MKSKYLNQFLSQVLFVMLILISGKLKAQNAVYYDVMNELGLIQQNFICDSGQYISCSMTYLYSMESAPQKFTDSLQGQYKASGKSKYIKISQMESIQNDSMLITVYNDDKVIVAMPKPAGSNLNMGRGLMLNNIDSVFISANVSSVTINQKGNQKQMTFKFVESSQYYNCVLLYDAATYIPASLSYVFKQTRLTESAKAIPDGNVITIRFNGYNRSPFDVTSLNTSKYIQVDQKGKASGKPAFSAFNILQPTK